MESVEKSVPSLTRVRRSVDVVADEWLELVVVAEADRGGGGEEEGLLEE